MFSVVFLLVILLYYSDGDIQTSESAIITRQVKSLTCNSDVNLSRLPGQYVVYHEWNQAYNAQCNCSTINLPSSMESFNTQYTVDLHKFDNNTNIYSLVSVYKASNGLQHMFNLVVHCSGSQRKWINLVDDGYYRYQVNHIFTYEDKKSAKFSCLQYSHLSNLLGIQVGWITTDGDRIYTYNATEIIINLSDVHNGSMCCCLYYTTSVYNNGKHIQRFVKDLTLLIYQKEAPNSKGLPTSTTTASYYETESNRYITTSSTTAPFITDTSNATGIRSRTTNKTGKTPRTTTEPSKYSGTANETSKYSGTANETSKYSGTANETSKYSGTANETSKYSGTANETSKYSDTTNRTDQKTNNTNTTGQTTGTANRTDSSNYDADNTDYVNLSPSVIIISSISAIMVLLVVGICAIRRHCWKKTNRPERAQLPLPQIPGTRLRPANEPDPNTPFYLNLLFRRECELEIQAREEPHYEEVMYQ